MNRPKSWSLVVATCLCLLLLPTELGLFTLAWHSRPASRAYNVRTAADWEEYLSLLDVA